MTDNNKRTLKIDEKDIPILTVFNASIRGVKGVHFMVKGLSDFYRKYDVTDEVSTGLLEIMHTWTRKAREQQGYVNDNELRAIEFHLRRYIVENMENGTVKKLAAK
jgi:hypothetical protein